MHKNVVVRLLAFWVSVLLFISGSARDLPNNQVFACEENTAFYTVQPDDQLFEIGFRYGSIYFWEVIYIANAHIIIDPDLIYPDQLLVIPQPISSYKQSGLTIKAVLDNPFCKKQSLPISSVDFSRLNYYSIDELTRGEGADSYLAKHGDRDEPLEKKPGQLSEFREAFNSVVNDDESSNKTGGEQDSLDLEGQRDAVQQESERQIMMEIDGMVLDETRSKIGRDFYNVFYSHWQAPKDASNFSISISEQASPSLGTIIYVEVNDTETFRMRIQPRYEFIQQAGQYAVRQTYSHLQNNDHRLQIY